MAEKVKHVTPAQLDNLANRVNANFARKSALTALKEDVDGLTIPVNVSDLPNDAKYQTDTEVAAAIAAADHMKRKKVASVDDIDLTADDAEQYIYLVPSADGKDGNEFAEYLVLDGKLERAGDWAVDLSDYVAKEDGKGLSSNDFTDEDKAKLDGIETATDAEIDAMLDEVFGTSVPPETGEPEVGE